VLIGSYMSREPKEYAAEEVIRIGVREKRLLESSQASQHADAVEDVVRKVIFGREGRIEPRGL
jgi:hypothetical protein